MPDLAAIRARLASYERDMAEIRKRGLVMWMEPIKFQYIRDVTALLDALDACEQFSVNGADDPSKRIYVVKCSGHRLPRPVMWKVAMRGDVLAKDGEWEWEPIPSGRDDAFYARCRFDTFEEAWRAALAAMDEKEPSSGGHEWES